MILSLLASKTSPSLPQFALDCLSDVKQIIKKYWAFLLLDLGFLGFIYWNEGIVVGDRTSHTASLHWMQVFYLLTAAAAYIPVNFNSLHLKNWVWLSALLGCAVVAWQSRVEHLYLVSDNRHFTFYIWRVIKAYSTPFLAISAASALCVLHPLTLHTQLWLLCSAAVLVPAPLIEPRYFIMPLVALAMRPYPQPSEQRRWGALALNVGTTVLLTGVYKQTRFIW